MNDKSVSNYEVTPIADKFKLWGKWFWVGVIIALLNSTAGLVFGIALLTEKKYRREGWIIVLIGLVITIAIVLRLIKLNYYP